MNTRAEAQHSSEDASDNGKRSLVRRLLDFVFGYDFFISYSWSDGAAYATALASRLEADRFAVFLDRTDYASGDNWKKVGAWTLRRTGQLILVGSPAAVRSDPVLHEVEIFSKTRRRIVPIDFAGSLRKESDSRLALYVPRDSYDQGTGGRPGLRSFGGDPCNHSPNLQFGQAGQEACQSVRYHCAFGERFGRCGDVGCLLCQFRAQSGVGA
jgi:hypothetical protein